VAEDYRRLPSKIRRCFDHTPTDLSTVQGSKNDIKNDITRLDKNDIFICGVALLSICNHTVHTTTFFKIKPFIEVKLHHLSLSSSTLGVIRVSLEIKDVSDQQG